MESRILKAYGAARFQEEDEDYERSNGPNRPKKKVHDEYDKEYGKNKMGKPLKPKTIPKKNLSKTPKKPRYDPEVLSEIEGDILDEESYEPSETVSGAQQSVRKAARKRIRQTLPEVYDFVFERGEHEDAGFETVQDAQAFVKRRAQEIYNRRRGIKPKKVKNKMGGNNSAIFSGANTINFTKNGDGTDTVTPMGASAQDIKTAYRKASLNA